MCKRNWNKNVEIGRSVRRLYTVLFLWALFLFLSPFQNHKVLEIGNTSLESLVEFFAHSRTEKIFVYIILLTFTYSFFSWLPWLYIFRISFCLIRFFTNSAIFAGFSVYAWPLNIKVPQDLCGPSSLPSEYFLPR